MNIEELYTFCAQFKGSTAEFPFDQDTLAMKVGGKIFLLSSLSNWESGEAKVNLKCDPEHALELRAQYSSVSPGFHMNKKHWNTVDIHGDVPLEEVRQMIQDSYLLVFKSLTKKLQLSIEEQQ